MALLPEILNEATESEHVLDVAGLRPIKYLSGTLNAGSEIMLLPSLKQMKASCWNL